MHRKGIPAESGARFMSKPNRKFPQSRLELAQPSFWFSCLRVQSASQSVVRIIRRLNSCRGASLECWSLLDSLALKVSGVCVGLTLSCITLTHLFTNCLFIIVYRCFACVSLVAVYLYLPRAPCSALFVSNFQLLYNYLTGNDFTPFPFWLLHVFPKHQQTLKKINQIIKPARLIKAGEENRRQTRRLARRGNKQQQTTSSDSSQKTNKRAIKDGASSEIDAEIIYKLASPIAELFCHGNFPGQ